MTILYTDRWQPCTLTYERWHIGLSSLRLCADRWQPTPYPDRWQPNLNPNRWPHYSLRDDNPIPNRRQPYTVTDDKLMPWKRQSYTLTDDNPIDRQITTKPIAWHITTNTIHWLMINLYHESWQPYMLTDDKACTMKDDNFIPWEMTNQYA